VGEDLQGDAVAVHQKYLRMVRHCVHGLKNVFLDTSVSMLGAPGWSKAKGPLAQLV
jgi:hypothetical protein